MKYVCQFRASPSALICGAPLDFLRTNVIVVYTEINPENGHFANVQSILAKGDLDDITIQSAAVVCIKNTDHTTGWLGLTDRDVLVRGSAEAEAIQKGITVLPVTEDENQAISDFVNANAGTCQSDLMRAALADGDDAETLVCAYCNHPICPDPAGSEGVWVHDPDWDDSHDLDEDHAAIRADAYDGGHDGDHQGAAGRGEV